MVKYFPDTITTHKAARKPDQKTLSGEKYVVCPETFDADRCNLNGCLESAKNECYPQSGLNSKKKSKYHFHCPQCQHMMSRREHVREHLGNCRENKSSLHGNSESVVLVPVKKSRTCYQRGIGCRESKHFHCNKCNKYTAFHLSRVEKHFDKCSKIVSGINSKYNAELIHNSKHLQNVVVDKGRKIYLVRGAAQGPGKPVTVNLDTMSCSSSKCNNFVEISKISKLEPEYYCKHIRSCKHHKDKSVAEDMLTPEVLKRHHNDLSDSDESRIRYIMEQSIITQSSVIVDFEPLCLSGKKSDNVYFSVLYGTAKAGKYINDGRVLVTYNRSTKTHTCDCSNINCIHRLIAMAVTDQPSSVKESQFHENHGQEPVLEEDAASQNERIVTDKILREVMYIYERKKVPLLLSFDEKQETTFKGPFIPEETVCAYCPGSIELELDPPTKAVLFKVSENIKNVQIHTKTCPNCKLTYRYQEISNGVHNFNNTSLFSLRLLEDILVGYASGTSLEERLSVSQDNIDPNTGYTLNEHHIAAGLKHYLSLKDFNCETHCLICGLFPQTLVFDAIRKVSCNIVAKDVIFDENGGYSDHSSFMEECCLPGLLRGMIPKRLWSKTLSKSFEFKKYSSLPAFYVSGNNTSNPPVSGRSLPRNVGPLSADEERPELEEITPGLIRRILESDNAYKDLTRQCRKFGIDTIGGIPQMIERILANSDKFSEVFKNFTSIEGKTGGILRAFCPHGCLYVCKLLILPEGITDYSQIFLGMRVKPTFLISDVARLFAQNIEKQVPGLLGEFMGLIGDPGDTKLVEDIGLGKKISLHVTATQDTFDLQSHTDMKPHPLTGQVLNYFLYDRFHQFNHKESDHILRLIDNVHELKGAINSQVVEQQNNIMSRCKDFLNKMTLDLHYIIILYIMLTRNIKLNDKYIDSVRKDAQFAGKQLSLDQFGRLVIGEGGSSNIRQVSDATYQYIPKPPLESLDPLKISWLNSILYVIFYSDIFQEVLKK